MTALNAFTATASQASPICQAQVEVKQDRCEQGQGCAVQVPVSSGVCAGGSWPSLSWMQGQDSSHDGSPVSPLPCLVAAAPSLWRFPAASGEVGDSHLYPEVMCFSLFPSASVL